MIEYVGLLLVGLVCLFFGGNWLVRGASNLALSFGLSILIIGLTIVAIGTSMPELLVSVQAALAGSSDLAIGNVLGSNIANIGLILGATGLITPLGIKAILLRREIPILILFTLFTYILTLDGELSRPDGVLLLFSFAGFNTMFYYLAKQEQDARRSARSDDGEPRPRSSTRLKELSYLGIGIIALVLGSRFMVEGAVHLARQIGVSELVIAITLVAFGTSLPELAASLAAAFHKETDLAIGNIVGSNIANLLLILGVTATLRPIAVDRAEVQLEFIVMIAFTIMLAPFVRKQQLGRRQSAVFLGAYTAFIIYSLFSGNSPGLLQ